MTIKSQGGVFSRNPTFNNVDVEGNLSINGEAVPSPENTLTSFDIGSTVQDYDVNTAKLDLAQTFTASQTFDSVDVEINNASLVIGTSGEGIDFSATPGSGDSELFDDYERGSFSPILQTSNNDMGSSGFSKIAYYTKIGNVCYISFYLFTAGLTSAGTGDAIIKGLPFNSAVSVQHSLSVSRSSRFATNPPITAAVSPGDNFIILFSTPHTTASSPTATKASDINVSGGNQNIIYIAGSYIVA